MTSGKIERILTSHRGGGRIPAAVNGTQWIFVDPDI